MVLASSFEETTINRIMKLGLSFPVMRLQIHVPSLFVIN